jgi:hypothetical protein
MNLMQGTYRSRNSSGSGCMLVGGGGSSIFYCALVIKMLVLSKTLAMKSKAVPLHHAGAKGERQYSSCSFLISALDGEKFSA